MKHITCEISSEWEIIKIWYTSHERINILLKISKMTRTLLKQHKLHRNTLIRCILLKTKKKKLYIIYHKKIFWGMICWLTMRVNFNSVSILSGTHELKTITFLIISFPPHEYNTWSLKILESFTSSSTKNITYLLKYQTCLLKIS